MLLTLLWMCWCGTRIIQLEFEVPMAYRIIFMPTLDVAANSDIFPIFLTFQKVDKNSQRKSQKIIPKMVPSRNIVEYDSSCIFQCRHVVKT